MPKLFQITIEANINSVGRIAEQIGQAAMQRGWESYITYSRSYLESESKLIKINSRFDIYRHVLMTRLFDRHCLHSTLATKKLVSAIKEIDPDIILLHHIHGYFIDMRILFDYLATAGKPVVWIFHDCWAFTGHCAHFDCGSYQCDRWMSECHDCPLYKEYPASLFSDRSQKNFRLKKKLFNSVPNLSIVSVSKWMNSLVERSFLKNHNLVCIPNGIDIQRFDIDKSPDAVLKNYGIKSDSPYIIGVASTWTIAKGFNDFIKLRAILPESIQIVMVGVSRKQINELPDGIIGIPKTDSVAELMALYSAAAAFVNPTYSDTFPTVNIESQACGTPVITYNSCGSPEIVADGITGLVVERGNVAELANAVLTVVNSWDLGECAVSCRNRVVELYDRRKNFDKYIDLFDNLL